jgi:transcriptional regulator with GAF, ATPase, and Fis domain
MAVDLIGCSRTMEEIRRASYVASESDYPVLITGETGVGKEVVARTIHRLGLRRSHPFVPINCAAIPDHLAESELFGHKKGAFTDATQDRIGLIGQGSGGTVFFDEVTELSARLQPKLLRVLESWEIRLLGDTSSRKIDIRFISATNRNIREEIEAGRFRKDIFYRISTISIDIPPLRQRREDIGLFIEHILLGQSQKFGKSRCIDEKARAKLLEYDYPGNVRELENVIKRAFLKAEGDQIRALDIEFDSLNEKNGDDAVLRLYFEMRKHGKSYWETIHKRLLSRELNLGEVRAALLLGLREAGGSYKTLARLLNAAENKKNYKKFIDAIRRFNLKDR